MKIVSATGMHDMDPAGMLKSDWVCDTGRIGKDHEKSFELQVPDGSVVTGFNVATLCRGQLRIVEVNADETTGAVLQEWKVCGKRSGLWTAGSCCGDLRCSSQLGRYPRWFPRNYTPEFIPVPVTTDALRFKVIVRQTFADDAQAGVAVFRALGIAAPSSLPVPTSVVATLRNANVVDLSCDAVDGAAAYVWSKVGGDPTWSVRANNRTTTTAVEEVGSFVFTVRALFPPDDGWFEGGDCAPGSKSAPSRPTARVNVIEVLPKVVRFIRFYIRSLHTSRLHTSRH